VHHQKEDAGRFIAHMAAVVAVANAMVVVVVVAGGPAEEEADAGEMDVPRVAEVEARRDRTRNPHRQDTTPPDTT
jgi:hypothetical protein